MVNTKRFAEKLSEGQMAKVDEWWRGLTSLERRELRRDAGRPPARVVARFVESAEDTEASDDFCEYLVNHEIYLGDGPKYHICSAHPEARTVLAAGRIPAGFRCPRGEKVCPMRVLLDQRPGHDVQLSIVCDRRQ
jgi:hypothetical protein